jgi:S-formylglutathione hydrolase FrmB
VRRRRGVALAALVAVVAVVALVLRDGGGTAAAVREAERSGVRVTRITVTGETPGARRSVTVVVPAGVAPGSRRPLLVFLHGRGQDDRGLLSRELFRALAAQGRSAPIVAFPDGGDHSYWHDRRSGGWARYVTARVIPGVGRRFPVDRGRVAIGGVSMGGFGALDLAEHAPGRYCAVGAHSPALWATAGETAAGAFDDAEDFAAHDVIAGARRAPRAFTAQPVRVDAGDADPFLPGDRALIAALRAGGATLTLHTAPGGHDGDYWRSQWGTYLAFYAKALKDCRAR